MNDDSARPPHVQRCTYTEVRGTKGWQCLEADPHPDRVHRLPVDAEYGRDLDAARREWLAATLRDKTVLNRHLTRRIDDLQAIALDVLALHLTAGEPAERTREWARNTAPAMARGLGWI